jgi:hypothetical protein
MNEGIGRHVNSVLMRRFRTMTKNFSGSGTLSGSVCFIRSNQSITFKEGTISQNKIVVGLTWGEEPGK